MKFLVIRLGAIGDIVLTSPIVRCINNQLPLAEVHFLVSSKYNHVVEHNPYINRIHVWRNDDSLIESLSVLKFDAVIDLQGNEVSKRIIKKLQTTASVIDHHSFRKCIYTRLKINLLPEKHKVDSYFEVVKEFGVENDGNGLDFFIPEKDIVIEKDIPASHHLGFIAIAIGGSKFNKKMPVDKLKELCNSIQHPLMLLGGKEDFNAGYAVSQADPVKIYNACGKFNLNETADLIRKSKLLISHDTGLMHIAAALKKPIISVWGSTVPSLGMYPYYGIKEQGKIYSETIQFKKLWCRPCSVRGLDHCPLTHFKCMKKISVDEIRIKTSELLKAVQKPNFLSDR